MRREDVQLLIAALASTLGQGPDRRPQRSQMPLATLLARGIGATAATPVAGRLHAQAERAMLLAMQLTLQCYGAARDTAIVIDAELRRTFRAAAETAVKRAIEQTGVLCEPPQHVAALAALPSDLDAYEPAALGAFLADVIEAELLAGIGDSDMPLSFRDFLRSAGTGAPSWHDAFTLYFAWEAKNDPEPLRAVLSTAAADQARDDLLALRESLLARAPAIAQRFDAFLKIAHEMAVPGAQSSRPTDRARFVDLIALQAWHLAARTGVPAPPLVATLEPTCRTVASPVDIETELHVSAARLKGLWTRMSAVSATLAPVGDAAHALAQGDLAAAQQALSAAFVHATTSVDRAEIRQIEGSLQSLAGLWRHTSRSYMAAADLLKGEFPDASLRCLVEVVHAFIREAESTGDVRAAETGAKLADNIVSSAARADPALRAEAGLAMALAHLVHRRISGQGEPLATFVRLVRRNVPLNALPVIQATASRAVVRIAEELARTPGEASRDAGESALAVDLVAAMRTALGSQLTLRDDALLLACIAKLRVPADHDRGELDTHREAARGLADALARVSRAESPYLWSALQGRLGSTLWLIAKAQEGEANREARRTALIALERALQECGHDRGHADAARYLATLAQVIAEPRTETSGGPPSDRAIEALRMAEALLPETAPRAERLQITQQLANVLIMAGRHAAARAPKAAKVLLEEAIATYRRATSFAEGDDSRHGLVRLLFAYARAITFFAEFERSRPRYEEAIGVYQKILDLTGDRKRHPARARAEQAVAELTQLIDTIRRAEGRYSQMQ